jgi:hypothetical protein
MLTSAEIGKQNGDTRTRKPEPGYLNLSIVSSIWPISLSHEDLNQPYLGAIL